MKNKFKFSGVLITLFSIFTLSSFPHLSRAAELRRCALESCHGLNLQCGFNAPDMCTQVYSIGDFCRQYAKCEITADSCKLVKNSILEKCIDCVKGCPGKSPATQFECEAKCRSKIEKLVK